MKEKVQVNKEDINYLTKSLQDAGQLLNEKNNEILDLQNRLSYTESKLASLKLRSIVIKKILLFIDNVNNLQISPVCKFYDLWFGFFLDTKKKELYIMIPIIGIKIGWKK